VRAACVLVLLGLCRLRDPWRFGTSGASSRRWPGAAGRRWRYSGDQELHQRSERDL